MTQSEYPKEGGKGDLYLAGTLARRFNRSVELSDEMVEYMAHVARNKQEPTKHRLAAARCIVDHEHKLAERLIALTPEYDFIQAAGGPSKAARWIAEHQDGLRALLDGKTLPGASSSQQTVSAPYIEPEACAEDESK